MGHQQSQMAPIATNKTQETVLTPFPLSLQVRIRDHTYRYKHNPSMNCHSSDPTSQLTAQENGTCSSGAWFGQRQDHGFGRQSPASPHQQTVKFSLSWNNFSQIFNKQTLLNLKFCISEVRPELISPHYKPKRTGIYKEERCWQATMLYVALANRKMSVN